MKAYRITNLKDFMNKLLLSDSFDHFLLEEGTIVTFNTFLIDGHIKKEFYSSTEPEGITGCSYDFSLWQDMRSLCFQLIKGKRTPLSFKFVLLLLPEEVLKILAESDLALNNASIKSFTLTIKYEAGQATLITGISTNTFIMDKTPEMLWDEAFRRFMGTLMTGWEEI